jgi:diadenosine tetraphosphate (Ap4A) HIT family hydrolase
MSSKKGILQQTTRQCELCAEIEGRPSRFSRIYESELVDRSVATTQNFVVLPSLGQISDAHLMIVSKSHFTATANLDGTLRSELQDLLRRVKSWMEETAHPNVVIFENGDPQGFGKMACSVSHLHVHLVSTPRPITNLRRGLGLLGGQPIIGATELPRISESYSWVEFAQGDAVIIPRPLPSQTLRKLIAHEVGQQEWDWRKVGQERQLINLVSAARAGLTRTYANWSH